jgi:glycerol uptake facilitator-like aquaporin
MCARRRSALHYRRFWSTSSTSFANPAITVARSLSDIFAGIAPRDVLPFIVAQLMGAGVGAMAVSPQLKDRWRERSRRLARFQGDSRMFSHGAALCCRT